MISESEISFAVDQYIVSQMQARKVPGLALAVVKKGQVAKLQSYGLSNIELGQKVSPHTVFKLGSISKQFLATAVVLLANENRLGLRDPILEYLSDAPPSWKGITVEHLLTHTSGLSRDLPQFDPYKALTVTELVACAFPLPLEFGAGEEWAYSNIGYYVLASLIEAVTGKSFTAYVAETIFGPARMTSIRPASVSDVIPGRGSSYLTYDSVIFNAGDLLALRPSGAFVASVSDLIQWDLALRAGGLVSRNLQKCMTQPVRLNNGSVYPYGFGWMLSECNGQRIAFHGGTLWCYRAEIMRFLNEEFTVALLANHRDANSREMAFKIAEFYQHPNVASCFWNVPINLPKRAAAPTTFGSANDDPEVGPIMADKSIR